MTLCLSHGIVLPEPAQYKCKCHDEYEGDGHTCLPVYGLVDRKELEQEYTTEYFNMLKILDMKKDKEMLFFPVRMPTVARFVILPPHFCGTHHNALSCLIVQERKIESHFMSLSLLMCLHECHKPQQ